MNQSVRLQIVKARFVQQPVKAVKKAEGEEYLSSDGALLLQLQKDSEIRFGPAFYKAAIYSGDGNLIINFGSRRFFSYSGYGGQFADWLGPWCPTSPKVALVELLSSHAEPGAKIARMNLFDAARQLQVAAWDFETLVTHKMWSPDGRLYLFRDVYGIYVYSVEHSKLIPISISKSQHCFLLNNSFACVIEGGGEVFLFEGYSGNPLENSHLPEPGCTVKSVVIDKEKESLLVRLKCEGEQSGNELCYEVSVTNAR